MLPDYVGQVRSAGDPRLWMKLQLKQKGVPEGVIAEILGHANQSIATGRYGKRFRPRVLLEALEKLSYCI